MKKILLLILCMIFLVGTVSALELRDIDDVKYYNEEATTYTLENFFGLGKQIAELELKTPQDNKVGIGYLKVAEIEIKNGEYNYEEIINGIKLYNIKEDMKEFVRDIDYKYLVYEEVPNYENICVDKELVNKTIYQECSQVEKGTKLSSVWKDFTKNSLLKGEVITLGIFTDVQEGDKVEWVLNVYGNERLTKWAVWTEWLQEYYVVNDDNYYSMYEGDFILAQTFTPGNVSGQGNFTLQVVSLLIYRAGIPGTLNVGIKETNATGHPTGADISNGTMDGDTLTEDSDGAWYNITMTEVDLIEGTTYGLWADVPGGNSSNRVSWRGDNDDGEYYGGKGYRSLDGFLSWVLLGEDEFLFRTWGTEGSLAVAPVITLNSPIDVYNSSSSEIVFNGTAYDETNLINVSLYIDGVLNETNSSGINNTDYIFIRTLNDGNYNWTYDAWNNVSGVTTATTRTFTIDTTPYIQYENPTRVDTYNSTSSYVPINVSLTETYFKNITFSFYNGTLTEFYYADSTRYINESLADGVYNYNVTVWTTTDQSNTTILRNISLDTISPIITTNSSVTFDHQEINTNLTIYFNFTETNPDVCLYNYNGTNISIGCGNTSININTTTITNRDIIFYANDTFGRGTTFNVDWNYTVFENSQTFNTETFEGIINTFMANVTVIESNLITIAVFIYNGTSNIGSFSQSGNNSILTIDYLAPNVNADTNLTFYWSLVLSDSQIINLTAHNQTVTTINLDNCGVNTVVLYNYTIVDEGNQSLLSNTTAELNINLLDEARQIHVFNFSLGYSNINPFAVCINSNLSSSTYIVDSIVKYEAIGYSVEYYNIVSATITNITIPEEITLYDLFSADATEFKITFKAEDFTFVEDALIYIDRQYISENNTFKTVELPKTDSNGQTIGHFVRNDIVYNIRVIKEGVVLGNFKNIIAFCQDFTIGDCQMVLEAIPEDFTIFDYDEQLGIIFQILPTYNENTSAITFDFSTDDGTIKTLFMEVTRKDIFGNRSICNNTIVSSSGTLSCSFDPRIEDSVLSVDIFVDGQPVVFSNVILEDPGYGNLGYILWFFLTFLFILLFGHSKTEVLIGLTVSFIGAISLGITRGNIIGIGSAGIWILVIIILGIVKLNKDKPQ